MTATYRSTLCLLAFIWAGSLFAQPQDVSFQNFSTGYNEPLDLTHAGDERIFVVEKRGVIYVVDQQGNKNNTPFLDIRSIVNDFASERGLLGLAFHPNYKENGYFYLNYTNGSGATVIARYSVSANDPDVADPGSATILLTISQPYSNHNGGCIKFGSDGYLYIGMGDGGSGGDPLNAGQTETTLLGKMLRIDVDGASPYGIPADNPYVNDPQTRDEIWAFGLRNPWRFSFDRMNGDLWIGDVGQNAWEEIDYWPITSTTPPNFGWRCYEGNATYNTSGCGAMSNYDFPVYVYDNNAIGCSVTGGYAYRGPRYANWWGVYFFTDYCSGRMWYSEPDGNGGYSTTEFDNLSNFNYASFGEDVYGQLYLLGLSSGQILRLADTTCTPVAYIDAPSSLSLCSSEPLRAYNDPSLSFQWQLNGSDIPGATSADHFVSGSGNYRVIVSNGSCADTSDAVNVTLVPAPTASLTGLDSVYCPFDVPVIMTGSPSGGTFSGPGVTGSSFNPDSAGLGTHSIIYAYTDGNTNCTGYDTAVVTVTPCVGLAGGDPFAGFRLYPNPSGGTFAVEFTLKASSEVRFRVMNSMGATVHEYGQTLLSGAQKLHFDLGAVADGLYFLVVETDDRKGVQKFMVRK
jgi:glucose/arabinose dehydrogenase